MKNIYMNKHISLIKEETRRKGLKYVFNNFQLKY